ncbi:hypothetical protein LTR28_003838 [Elasticomyces elasticus]|nr:hypothetical protein LTR28_003838 [Elasticomyces elasticus]
MGVPKWAFFIAKYFGSGVIIGTSFIHLLSPANDALRNPCLTGPITDYDWVSAIVLMTIFILFFVELMTMRYATFGHSHDEDDYEIASPVPADHAHAHSHGGKAARGSATGPDPGTSQNNRTNRAAMAPRAPSCPTNQQMPGDDHLSHAREHTDNDDVSASWQEEATGHGHSHHHHHHHHAHGIVPETYAAQMKALFILEFGVIFHSIFIGLALAVSGAEFDTLYVVLVFHQTFEGLALGSRFGSVPWPKSKRWTPYLMGLGYGFSTPIAIAVGLAVRGTYPPHSQTTLIVNGVFDSVSAGILIYTGLVELMAHEFMFSNYMQRAPIRAVLAAFGTMCAGAGTC